MQGVNWINRTAISYATITLYVKHYKNENGVEHIDSDQALTGGVPGTTENRILDWTPKDHHDYVFGAVVGKSRRRKVDEIEDEFLKGGWLPDTQEHGVICSWIESDPIKNNGYNWTSGEVCRLVVPILSLLTANLIIDMGLPRGRGRKTLRAAHQIYRKARWQSCLCPPCVRLL